MNEEQVTHTLQPLYDGESRILVLGTMPSPKSREKGFYYAHPRNRFWPVLADILGEPTPEDNLARKQLALRHHIALWDVLKSCTIAGAADGSIKAPVPNDLRPLLTAAPIRAVFTTGGKAHTLYRQLCQPVCGMPDIPLPSTSPANCRMPYDTLRDAYSILLSFL